MNTSPVSVNHLILCAGYPLSETQLYSLHNPLFKMKCIEIHLDYATKIVIIMYLLITSANISIYIITLCVLICALSKHVRK